MAIEGILEALVEQNQQLTLFVAKLSKLAADFQTKQLRQLLTTFGKLESQP